MSGKKKSENLSESEIITITEPNSENNEIPEPIPQKTQNIKVEIPTEKMTSELKQVFNDGFKELGKLFKPENPAPPSPEPQKPVPEPEKKTWIDNYNDLMGV